jgi:hypothetical protein
MDDSESIRGGILCFMDARETLAQVARRLIGVIVANASVSSANLRWHEEILLGASFRQLIQSVLDCSVADCGKLRRERFAVLDLFGALLEGDARTQPLLLSRIAKFLEPWVYPLFVLLFIARCRNVSSGSSAWID